MVFSLADFNDLDIPNNTHPTTPTTPNSPGLTPPPNSEPIEQSASQQNSALPTPTLDPALFTISPPRQTTTPILHGEDLTQLARHLALQKSLLKNSADELVLFAKVFASLNPPIFLSLRLEHSDPLENNLSGLLQLSFCSASLFLLSSVERYPPRYW